MNPIGKILTLLILLMSIFFFAAALMVGAAHRNWKEEATKYEGEAQTFLRQLNDAKNSTGIQKQVIEREKVSRAQQIAVLASQVKQLENQLEERNDLLREEIETSQSRLDRMREAVAKVSQLDTELNTVKQRNKDLVDNIASQFEQVQNLTQENFDQQNQISSLTEMVSDLTANVAKKSKVMRALGADDDFMTRDIVPRVSGNVVGTQARGDYFVISLGSDDGLRVGHEFDIYRGDRYIGRAQVTRVEADLATLKIQRGFMKDVVREGDRVTSEF